MNHNMVLYSNRCIKIMLGHPARVKQCCYRAACTKGVAMTKPDGHQYKAPECDAGQQAHQARRACGPTASSRRLRRGPRRWSIPICFTPRRSRSSRRASPRSRRSAAPTSRAGATWALRASSRTTPPRARSLFCCSKLAKDDPLWHKHFTKCRTPPPNKCPYKGHEE